MREREREGIYSESIDGEEREGRCVNGKKFFNFIMFMSVKIISLITTYRSRIIAEKQEYWGKNLPSANKFTERDSNLALGSTQKLRPV